MKINEFYQPITLDDAYEKLVENSNNQVMGGGAWMKLSGANIDTLIQLGNLGLGNISETQDKLIFGAMVSLHQIEANKTVGSIYNGMLKKAINCVMGIQVRNVATIGGTVMGRYPFSDILTALLTMKTKLVFYKRKEIMLEDYLLEKKPERDLLLFVEIEKGEARGYFKKVGKTALDFAIVNVAVANENGKLSISVGARPGLARLCHQTMDYINQNELSDEIMQSAALKVLEELDFSSNSKAGKDYRMELAKVYVLRGLRAVTCHED